MATQSSILAWRTPWTEEPGGLQSMGLPRVRHDLMTEPQLGYLLGLNVTTRVLMKKEGDRRLSISKMQREQLIVGVLEEGGKCQEPGNTAVSGS